MRPPEPTSWSAHSRVETSLDYWRRKCSHRPKQGGGGLPLGLSPQPPSQPQSNHPSQPRPQPVLHTSSLSLLRGLASPLPLGCPAPPIPQALRGPDIHVLQLAWSHRALALTSYFSGAPEMRKSLLNRTGGLSPAEKPGLSVTFFLQSRTWQPLWDSQDSFSPPFLHPHLL